MLSFKKFTKNITRYLPDRALQIGNRFRDLSIGKKLNLGFGILVILTILVVGRNYFGSVLATDNIHRTQRVRVPTALISGKAQKDLLMMLSYVRGYLATGDSDFRDRYQQARKMFEEDLRQMERLSQTQLTPTDRDRFERLEETYTQWSALPNRLFALRNRLSENQPALGQLEREGEIPIATVLGDIETIIEQQQERSPSTANLILLGDLSEFKTSFALQISALRSYLSTRDPAFRFDYIAQQQANQKALERLRDRQGQLTSSQSQAFDRIAENRAKLLELIPQLFAIVEGDRYREDLYLLQNQAEPLAETMLVLLAEIVDDQQDRLATELDRSYRELIAAQWQTLLITAIALVLGGGMAWVLRRQIAEPIEQLTLVTANIKEGDLDVRANIESGDEIGTLAIAFNQMTDSLKQSRQDLEEYSHSLEKRVEKRTLEIQQKNEELAKTLSNLQKTQAQLIQTEKMSGLGQMVAGIAHEVNNPINFIHGNIKFVLEYSTALLELVELYQREYPEGTPMIADKIEDIDLGYIQEDFPNILRSMQLGSQRVRGIVLSLRNFSRLDEAEMKEVNLHEGIESTLMILGNKIRSTQGSKPIQIVKNYGKLPLVECYAGQLNQVFMNILSNAIDALEEFREASPDRPDTRDPQITITTEHLEARSRVFVSIKDNGKGIPEKARSRLFDPFFTTKPVGKGTGLGLSICYQIIVEKHQGMLDCFSEVGEGAEFRIEIPVRQ